MEKMGKWGIFILRTALKGQQGLPLRRGDQSKIVGGDEEAGLDLAFQGLLMEEMRRGVTQAAKSMADPRRMGRGQGY
uniref:Uncharacterized protein n=1 Tax=Rhizophora mucronata TaxID=61149 RepID=A0A2P2N825_RHIMU